MFPQMSKYSFSCVIISITCCTIQPYDVYGMGVGERETGASFSLHNSSSLFIFLFRTGCTPQTGSIKGGLQLSLVKLSNSGLSSLLFPDSEKTLSNFSGLPVNH